MLSSLVADCSPKCPESSESHEGGSNIRPKHKHETRRHVRQRNKGETTMRSSFIDLRLQTLIIANPIRSTLSFCGVFFF